MRHVEHSTPPRRPAPINSTASNRADQRAHLADPPSPSGRLGDRIYKLRMRCVEALGRNAFEDAYAYLKSVAGEVGVELNAVNDWLNLLITCVFGIDV